METFFSHHAAMIAGGAFDHIHSHRQGVCYEDRKA